MNRSSWISRSVRLALVVGVLSASWYAWTIFQVYAKDRDAWQKVRFVYECAARFDDATLERHKNASGNINAKGVACSANDAWVSPSEITEVRNGTYVFAPLTQQWDGFGTLYAGVGGFIVTMLLAAALMGVIKVTRWVWGA